MLSAGSRTEKGPAPRSPRLPPLERKSCKQTVDGGWLGWPCKQTVDGGWLGWPCGDEMLARGHEVSVLQDK